ncbi:MAG TPA: DUF512 domain-containing protein [Candidatus Xenobia bacterium]|jgi:putative radical SAM enzyme (TIGR03279 family)
MVSGAIVKSVQADSLGARVGLKPGDVVERINNRPIQDVLDFLYLSAAPRFDMDVSRQGLQWRIPVRRVDDAEPFGLELEEELVDGIRNCRCKCDFCFLDQMPKGFRPTLYVKDDDYRLSFLYANFVTLTNLDDNDWRKIREYRMTPMYVSVHATNPEVRRRILKNPRSGQILDQLRTLSSWGIQYHTQLVVTPGINDGEELDRSIRELAELPDTLSIGVVPVGLTRWRDRLAPLSTVTPALSRAIIAQVKRWQTRFEAERGTPYVFLSDEFYLLANQPFPSYQHYRDFPQLENGVGMARLLTTEFNRRQRTLPTRLAHPRKIVIATGVLAARILQPLIERLNRIENLHNEVIAVQNDWLGHTVTVAGLLGGVDLTHALETRDADLALIPDICLKDGKVFLDDTTLDAMRAQVRIPVQPVPVRASALIAAALGVPEKKTSTARDLKWAAV